MAKFIIDTADNEVSKSMLEMIIENELDYNVYIKEINPIDEENIDELAEDYACDHDITMEFDEYGNSVALINAYKAGYRKAMEE